MKWRVEFFHPILGEVFDDDLERAKHAHRAWRPEVERVAHEVFEQAHVHHGIPLGDADFVAELKDGLRRIAAPPDSAEGRHPRIVPTAHELLLDELQQPALAEHRVGQIQPREFGLLRR